MPDYFTNFPRVDYGGIRGINIMLKAGIARDIIEKFGVFYPYRVKDHERADTIAFDYYGDSKFVWLVYLANNVVDPYRDWPMNDADFFKYIVEKYGSYEYAASTVHHYENSNTSITYWMSPYTRTQLDPAERVGFDVETTYWEWEERRNEDRKTIRLLSKRYAQQALDELETLFSGDRS